MGIHTNFPEIYLSLLTSDRKHGSSKTKCSIIILITICRDTTGHVILIWFKIVTFYENKEIGKSNKKLMFVLGMGDVILNLYVFLILFRSEGEEGRGFDLSNHI